MIIFLPSSSLLFFSLPSSSIVVAVLTRCFFAILTLSVANMTELSPIRLSPFRRVGVSPFCLSPIRPVAVLTGYRLLLQRNVEYKSISLGYLLQLPDQPCWWPTGGVSLVVLPGPLPDPPGCWPSACHPSSPQRPQMCPVLNTHSYWIHRLSTFWRNLSRLNPKVNDEGCVPARFKGKGQDAKEIGHNLARERPKFGHDLVRKRQKIGHSLVFRV